MKISKSILLACVLSCFVTVNCDHKFKDDKIKFQIEVQNDDQLLSSDHLKVKKNIIHNGKKILLKLFEKIHENVLERAYIVEEIDRTNSLTEEERKNLLSLDEEFPDKNLEEFLDEEKETDEEMKVISSEESSENDVHMIRKVYKGNKGRKEITYSYMKFIFQTDLEKMNEVTRSDLIKSLDYMPDYLSFLSPNEQPSDTENLLEEESESYENGSGKKIKLDDGISFAESVHETSDDMKINITKYIHTLDKIINSIVNKSEKSGEYPPCYEKLIEERENLYNLSLHRTENEEIIHEEYWKNKSKIEKYVLYEVLTNLKHMYFHDIHEKHLNKDHETAIVHDQFIDLIEKSINCHNILDNTEILDILVLRRIDTSNDESENSNFEDKKVIEQCLNLYKLLLDKNMLVSSKDIEDYSFDDNETKEVLHKMSKESLPIQKFILRKGNSNANNIESDYISEESTEDDTEEVEDAEIEDSDDVEQYVDNEKEDESNLNGAKELFDDLLEGLVSNLNNKRKSSSFLEEEPIKNSIENNDDSVDDISTEMFNEDPEIANETEIEHNKDISEILNVEKEKITDDENINAPIEMTIQPHNANKIISHLEQSSNITDDDDEDDDLFSLDDGENTSYVDGIFDEDNDNDNDNNKEDQDNEVDTNNEDDLGDFENDEDADVDVDDDTNVDDDNDNDEIVDEDVDDEDVDEDADINDDDDDEDDNTNDKKKSKGSLVDQMKKKLKKEFNNALNSGKEMGKEALSKLVDTAEKKVNKLTTKMTQKIKNKLNKGKDGKGNKSKSVKKGEKGKGIKKPEVSKNKNKQVKKSGNGNKKVVKKEAAKNDNKNKVKDAANSENLRSSNSSSNNVTKPKGKPSKKKPTNNTSSLSSPNPKKNSKLRKGNKKSSFIGLTLESMKRPTNKKINKTVSKINAEMNELKTRKNRLIKELKEPTVSDKKVLNDFEKYLAKKDHKLKK